MLEGIVGKEECCGCTACLHVCPVKAITLEMDEEGFSYPQINEQCIECGLCRRACPILNATQEESHSQYGYVVQNKDKETLRDSTSGGAFSVLAEYILEKQGVVFGAAVGKNLLIEHLGVRKEEELSRIRGSKYVQSNVGDTFVEVKEALDCGKLVLYSGTPCQIEGLLCFLGRKYSNLFTVDVVCRAVASPVVYRKYLEVRRSKLKQEISGIRFRDKYFGYKYSALSLLNDKGEIIYHNGIETDEFLRAFFSNICSRPSCYHCAFKKKYRISDFTLWDCFDVKKTFPEADNDKGATRVLVHTEAGHNLFLKCKDKMIFKRVSPDLLIADTKEMLASVSENKKRSSFFIDMKRLDSQELFIRYFPNTFMVRFEKAVRMTGIKFGFYKAIRNVYKKVFGDRKR